MSKRLAAKVKSICCEKGLQLKELASAMDVKPESLSRTLNGNPQLTTLENIAKSLNVGVADLFDDGRHDNVISLSTTPDSLRSIIVYKGKTYIADNLPDLLAQVKTIANV